MRKYALSDLWIRVILFFAICTVLIFSLQAFVLPFVETVFFGGVSLPETFANNIVRAMNGVVGVGLVFLFLRFDRSKMNEIGLEWNAKFGKEWFIIGIPIAFIALIPTVIIELIFGIVTFLGLLDIIGLILTLFVTVVAIGMGEELLFRGYIQRILETNYSFETSAIISAFLFGLLHFSLFAPGGNLFSMVAILFSAFAIGLSLSYTFKVTNYNMILPISIHGFWDFFLFAFQAEFAYETLAQALIEILASIAGAGVIFYLVYEYKKRKLSIRNAQTELGS